MNIQSPNLIHALDAALLNKGNTPMNSIFVPLNDEEMDIWEACERVSKQRHFVRWCMDNKRNKYFCMTFVYGSIPNNFPQKAKDEHYASLVEYQAYLTKQDAPRKLFTANRTTL